MWLFLPRNVEHFQIHYIISCTDSIPLNVGGYTYTMSLLKQFWQNVFLLAFARMIDFQAVAHFLILADSVDLELIIEGVDKVSDSFNTL